MDIRLKMPPKMLKNGLKLFLIAHLKNSNPYRTVDSILTVYYVAFIDCKDPNLMILIDKTFYINYSN